ncbi:Rossmann-like and DUF2520 domain-containing protein [Streptomonospora nanhaiensis]|uniref:Putative short-subunit dehydrogenase-like oxidoreductase (DUF2520 family) n=1 Tax=Streptomonospora nanhaiensis TaxID=1323731 RepID=A0A853BNT5_9ACTN|nr:DUF2520 domain-containing protein [Streptomonospora nanhaiensis]MBV2361757.1 DUF2520 domain-containing protein [Streptomonospora nanhaiensis]MBX9391255.1 DUF2520 domain-containing protein [Streptomonospora nanhaiensis]NYI96424.1 putative short-subunit dehydrogenase-like oxidoreductase (DUF2520 family) [Streptomonospora nanhaiensis]
MRPQENSERPARLRVGVVGAGRVGSALGAALARAGHEVVAASAVSERSRRLAEARLPTARLTDPSDVVDSADLVLLTVPDDALEPLVRGLVETGADVTGTFLVHTSGAHGHQVLAPATAAGALPLALHPVMTFTGRDEDLDRLASASFGVTAPDTLRPIAEALVVEMGAEPVWIAEEHRTLYHTALAGGANHLVTLVAESAALLGAAGVDNPGRLLGPLLGAALDNALRLGMDGLSGPVLRGDTATVAAHIAELRRHSPESVPAYIALARLTADRALAAGLLKPHDAERLLDVLQD